MFGMVRFGGEGRRQLGGLGGVRVADQSREHALADPRAVRFHFRQPPIGNEKSV